MVPVRYCFLLEFLNTGVVCLGTRIGQTATINTMAHAYTPFFLVPASPRYFNVAQIFLERSVFSLAEDLVLTWGKHHVRFFSGSAVAFSACSTGFLRGGHPCPPRPSGRFPLTLCDRFSGHCHRAGALPGHRRTHAVSPCPPSCPLSPQHSRLHRPCSQPQLGPTPHEERGLASFPSRGRTVCDTQASSVSSDWRPRLPAAGASPWAVSALRRVSSARVPSSSWCLALSLVSPFNSLSPISPERLSWRVLLFLKSIYFQDGSSWEPRLSVGGLLTLSPRRALCPLPALSSGSLLLSKSQR